MKKIIRITESKLSEIVAKIIGEQSITGYVAPPVSGSNRPSRPQLPREKWETDPSIDPESEAPTNIPQEKKNVVQGIQSVLGIPVDGIYGPQTARAVANFQKNRGIKPTGIIYANDLTARSLGVGFGNVQMLSPLGNSSPVRKPVAPVAPPRDNTPISSIPSKPTGNVGLNPQNNQAQVPDYQKRQGNYRG
jgi:peptidoglycan hydrolase-like protein with peptidoglycan-binding domain